MRDSLPRIYCIAATRAPVVAVLRRGPTDWTHVGRWDLERSVYEAGAWLKGRLFPRRCDLSPDGRWLCYFAHKPGSSWEHGEAYVAISRLPWLTALHAFATCGTWTRGFHFTDRRERGDDSAKLPIPFGLRATPVEQFATERRRGWQETADSPPRSATDAWDERRNAQLVKEQPCGKHLLYVTSVGHAGGEFRGGQTIDGLRVRYSVESNGARTPLDDLQWADWDATGRLLAATRNGRLEMRSFEHERVRVTSVADLGTLQPDPSAPPASATRW